MALPRVVIVGRPNVGKSSLFNWLAGRRIAIVDAMAGVTRDRVSALVQIGDEADARFFELVDTGGIGVVDRDELSREIEQQIELAMHEADLILFVVDAREGLMPLDEDVAHRLRYLNRPVVLVINKADTPELETTAHNFHKLGRGTPVFVSVHQKRNKDELLRVILERLPAATEKPAEAVMKVAVVGRPNTGKSTFINTLARAERMIVSEIPGTTRDSVDVRFELDGLPFIAIDTAGVRRKAKIRDDLDFFSMHRAERSIRRADVVFLFLDPNQGVARVDKQLADYIAQHYKPCVFVINKWDTILAHPDGPSAELMNKYATSVQHAFRTMAYAPLAFITAKTGKNVKALINLGQAMFKQARKRVGTGVLNRVLREAVQAHPPPMRENRSPKIYYAAQIDVAPPTMVIFVNSPSLFDAPYQRYLLNVFREQLPFRDIPIKLYLRARSQASGSGAARGSDPFDPQDLPSVGLDAEVNDLLSELEE
ncbi:MAG: GTPase Der [Isosphaeraceae bacterium]|jgi:GTP-binding protein|nr:MAG: GTPase Der [Isosphaeraceae bacterium]